MKTSSPIIRIVFCLFTTAMIAPAFANDFVIRAKVVGTQPIIETVYEPVETCRYQYQRSQRQTGNTGNKILGGILGGAAGSAVGKGSGRDAAAGVGVLLGSEIAEGDGELTGGELIGGIAGGIIGNQVGGGSGKTAATAAGVLVGSIVGDNIQNGNQPPATGEKVRVCDITEEPKKVITGYQVTFNYNGRQITDALSYEPGEYVNINVNVTLLEDRTSSYQ